MNFNRRLLVSICFAVAAAPLVIVTGARADHSSDSDSGWDAMTRGSGRFVSESRNVGAFTAIDLRDSSDVEIVIGSPASVVVQADDNVLGMVHTEVRGETLVIESRGSWHSWRGPKVRVQMPSITGLHIAGSGDVELHGVVDGHLTVSIEGSGDVNAEGSVDDVKLVIAGSGDARLGDLKARRANIEIDGSGDADVFASDSLVATVNGSGDIVYRGDPPNLQAVAHGSGEISRR